MVSLYDGHCLCYDNVAHLNWLSLHGADQDGSNGTKIVLQFALIESRMGISNFLRLQQAIWWVFVTVIGLATIQQISQTEYWCMRQIDTDWMVFIFILQSAILKEPWPNFQDPPMTTPKKQKSLFPSPWMVSREGDRTEKNLHHRWISFFGLNLLNCWHSTVVFIL